MILGSYYANNYIKKMKTQTKLTLQISFFTILFGLFTLIVAIQFIPSADKSHYYLVILFKELGMAILIAGVLVGTIELSTRARHEQSADELIEKINLNLLHATLKRKIPENIYLQVKEQILERNFVRKSLRVDYYLNYPYTDSEKLPPGWFWVKEDSEYSLLNISDDPQMLDIHVGFDPRIPISSQYYASAVIEAVYINSEKQDIKLHSKESSQGVVGKREFKKTISVKPGDAVTVRSCTVAMKRSDREAESIICAYPTQQLEMSVVDLGIIKELNFYLDALSPKSVPQPTEEALAGKKRWVFDYAFLPGQGIEVVWCRNDFLATAANDKTNSHIAPVLPTHLKQRIGDLP